MLSIARIRELISKKEIQQRPEYHELIALDNNKRLRPAAIMMPLVIDDGEWHLLFTRRSKSLAEHSGQVSFPGGAKEDGDKDLEEAALRETREEIGVKPEDIMVFGDLGNMPILTGYLVRPFVGNIPWPYPIRISHEEVESIFTIPLEWLADPDHHYVRHRNIDSQEIPVVYFDHYKGHQLWGFSAEMTLILIKTLELID
jgi:8-oxo-dGTP pyrophosphatase MutT (NUDIX family)